MSLQISPSIEGLAPCRINEPALLALMYCVLYRQIYNFIMHPPEMIQDHLYTYQSNYLVTFVYPALQKSIVILAGITNSIITVHKSQVITGFLQFRECRYRPSGRARSRKFTFLEKQYFMTSSLVGSLSTQRTMRS